MGENKPIREIETTIDKIEGSIINIGRVYENKVTKLLVDLSSILVEYPNATASLVVRQPNWQSYPATVTLNGMTLEWLITDAEIGLQSGTGEIQITVADGEQIYKSAIAQTVILPSILYKSGSIPDPIAHWISQAQTELEKTKEALNTAQNFIADLKQKLDNGELNGKPGPQGEKGDPGKDAPQEAVLYTAQTLDDAQKAQARENIVAADKDTVDQLKEDLGEIDNAVFDTTTTEELVNTNPIVEDGKTLYTSTYIAIQEQSNSSIATLTNVVVGETLYISSTVANTTTSWGFTFTDDRNKTIYHYYDESLSGLADKTNIEVTVPEGATKLYVSRLSSKGKPEVFRKKAVKRKTPKSNLIDVLHGKKLVVFGDSMAYGHTIPESVWTKLLAEKHGMILTNFAQNGTTITRKTTTMSGATFLDTDSVHAKVMNNLNNPVEADYIIVFGGTNDIARNDQCPLGTIDDATSQTFYGALNAICQRLIQTYPSGNICFITPYIRNAGLATTEICKQYVTAIHEVCEKFGGIPVFDNTVNGALDFSNSYQVNTLTMKDSYHLNEDGHKRAMHKYEVFLQGI